MSYIFLTLKSFNFNTNNFNHIYKMIYYISNNCQIIQNYFNITIKLKTNQFSKKY